VNDDDALAVLDRCGEKLYGLLVRITLRRDVAQELLQELFVKLASAKGFTAATDKDSYAFRAAIHLAMDWRKREAKRPMARAAVEEATVLATLIRDEQVQQVLAGLEALTELEREAFVLRYLEQMEYAEVGRRMGKTEHQARGLCHRAIVNLRQLLGVSDE